jgi:hypothetical protein
MWSLTRMLIPPPVPLTWPCVYRLRHRSQISSFASSTVDISIQFEWEVLKRLNKIRDAQTHSIFVGGV